MTTAAKGVLPEAHPANFGATLPYRAAQQLIAEADVVLVVGTLTVLFVVSWPLALAACITLPAFLIPARQVGSWRRELAARSQERQADLLAQLQDVLNVGGFLLMRLFGRAEAEAERFRAYNAEVMRSSDSDISVSGDLP